MRHSHMQQRRKRQPAAPSLAPVQLFTEQAHREDTASRTPGNRASVVSGTWSFGQIPVTRVQNAALVLSEQASEPVQRREQENRTGLPERVKTGVESLSGFSLDDVRVHYNSSKPAQVNALAYTQGSEIHVEPGQEKHLAHEAWHVVQQKQGRVRATMQMKGIGINDNEGLEREADVMGSKAVSMQPSARMQERSVEVSGKLQSNTYSGMHNPPSASQHTIQCFGMPVDPGA